MMRCGLVGCIMVLATPAHAGARQAFSLSGEAALVSDYRFRGVSLSGGKPAAQAGAWIEHETGAYAGIWASTIQRTDGGARVESDYVIGFTTQAAQFDIDANLTWYRYPSDRALDYAEANLTVALRSTTISPKLGLSYAPPQSALIDVEGHRRANVYVFGRVETTLSRMPVTLHSHIGLETGAFDLSPDGGKWDWEIGARYDVHPFFISLGYSNAHARRLSVPLTSALTASAGLTF